MANAMVSDVTKKEGKKNQTTLFTFTVTHSAAYDQPVTISLRTVNGTATTSDGDYNVKIGTLTFASGETALMRNPLSSRKLVQRKSLEYDR